MPTVLRLAGLRFVIYPGDHRPAHVHVIGRGGEAVFNLQCPKGPPVLREAYGLTRADVARIRATIIDHLRLLCSSWEAIHGQA
ncbi:MAG: DUF4160 domain-containing protein [Planctomycetota bacterium]